MNIQEAVSGNTITSKLVMLLAVVILDICLQIVIVFLDMGSTTLNQGRVNTEATQVASYACSGI